ncbi:MAG: hypothetical protein AB7O04_00460 [Hyphomonadaceae bacterium]
MKESRPALPDKQIAAAEARFSLSEAWAFAGEIVRMAAIVFGAPGEILARLFLSRQEGRDFRAYLAPIEDYMRRLLFIAALEIAPNLAPVRARARERKMCVRRERAPTLTMLPRARGGGRRGVRSMEGFEPARPSARRMEALLRICENPAPFARRLARRLAKLDPREIGFRRTDFTEWSPAGAALPEAHKEAERALAAWRAGCNSS